jgi:hypothetical protein
MMQGMQSFFSNPFGFFGGGLLDELLLPGAPCWETAAAASLARICSTISSPTCPLWARHPQSPGNPAQEEQPQEQRNPGRNSPGAAGRTREIPISEEEQSRFTRSAPELQRAAAGAQKGAVHEENFERAAQLRDQIRALEQDA